MNYNGEKHDDKLTAFVKDESVENTVEFILFRLGFKSNLRGTRYLKEAIVAKYTTQVDSLCKHLYPQIAAKYGTKGERVERSIRHAINEWHAAGNLVRANEMLGWQMISNYPPTNSEFISLICTWLRLEKTYADSASKKSQSII